MTFEGLGEMFEGVSADTCTGKFQVVLMGGRPECHLCADPGARTVIGASRIFSGESYFDNGTASDKVIQCSVADLCLFRRALANFPQEKNLFSSSKLFILDTMHLF